MEGGLLELPVVASLLFAVAAAPRPLRIEALLFRGLHVRHVLPVLLQHTTAVDLTPEALESTINVFIVSDFDTNRQGRSLRREFGFEGVRENLFDGLSTACDFVDLVQNGFFAPPVVPLQGSFGHRSALRPLCLG